MNWNSGSIIIKKEDAGKVEMPLEEVAPNIFPGLSHADQGVFQARPLVEKIKLGAVSLGEGPRWHVSYIDDVVHSFLAEGHHGAEVDA